MRSSVLFVALLTACGCDSQTTVGGEGGTGGAVGTGGQGGLGGSGGEGGSAASGGGGGTGGTGGNAASCRVSFENISCPCTEAGILSAIAFGSFGEITLDCDGQTTIVTEAEIVIDNDVILNGQGNLTVDGNGTHRVFSVVPGVMAWLRGLVVTNGAADTGGGIFSSGTLTVRDSTVSGNTAATGGGIYSDGALTVADSEVSQNAADTGSGSGDGAGVYNGGSGTLTLTNSSVVRNDAGGFGGGICNAGALTASNSTVSQNTSASDGGGIGNRDSGVATLNSSTVSRNSAAGLGGGISNAADATFTSINSTVSENESGDRSGGIYNEGSFVLTNVTLSGNTSTTLDPGIAHFGSGRLMTFTNTIVDGDCAGTGDFESKGGNVESPGNNCGFDDPTDQVNITPEDLRLEPLANNGGATETHALLPGSVAIDFANARRAGAFHRFTTVTFFQTGVGFDGASNVAVAGLNGDTIPDLVTANGDSDDVSELLGNGDGTFQAASSFAAGDRNHQDVAVADLDGDTLPDLVTANPNPFGGVSVLLNQTFR